MRRLKQLVEAMQPDIKPIEEPEKCRHADSGRTCEDLYDCCDCGGDEDSGCGCRGCWSCNACDVCR